MPKPLNFYLDDSGARRPDRKPGKQPAHGRDWFALGGVLINEEDEPVAREIHSDFLSRWSIESPLHSVEIRARNERFLWVQRLTQKERDRFYEDLYQMMRAAPVLGLACVIDRPGYNKRYFEKYGRRPWLLCKTAFTVAVERAAKHAVRGERKLRVLPEKCNKKDDNRIRRYYDDLKTEGLPFDGGRSARYSPLTAKDFQTSLYELRFKEKSSPMAQFADLFLWPICMGGYRPQTRPYARLMEDQKLIECVLSEDDREVLGSKYSCFDTI